MLGKAWIKKKSDKFEGDNTGDILLLFFSKNWVETLEMHGFPCRNARSPNRVQVVSL